MTTKRDIQDAVRDAVDELDARPDQCPWCGSTEWFAKHASKVHPEKYQEWKDNHTKVTIRKTVWVDE